MKVPTLQETVGTAAVSVDHVKNIRAVIDHLLIAAGAYAGGNVAACRRALGKADVALATTRAGFDRRHVERLPEITTEERRK